MTERDGNKEALLEHLFRVLQMVNDWLRFAEAKNGAVLAICGSTLGVLIGLMASVSFPSNALLGYVAACALLLAGSLAAALVSFIPITRLPTLYRRARATPPNTLFFADLAGVSASELLQETCLALGIDATETLPVHEHAAAQIVANSRITLWKFELASVATHLAAAAVVPPLLLLLLISKRRRSHP